MVFNHPGEQYLSMNVQKDIQFVSMRILFGDEHQSQALVQSPAHNVNSLKSIRTPKGTADMFRIIIRFNRFVASLFGIHPQETHYISVSDFTTDWVKHPDIQACMKRRDEQSHAARVTRHHFGNQLRRTPH